MLHLVKGFEICADRRQHIRVRGDMDILWHIIEMDHIKAAIIEDKHW